MTQKIQLLQIEQNSATDGQALVWDNSQLTWKPGTVSGGGASDTASEILTKLLTVDGVSSGLDSDLLDGQHGSYYLDASNLTGTLSAARLPAFTGDITTSAGGATTTLASVNSNVGSFGSTTAIPVITVNAKGLITAVSTAAIDLSSKANLVSPAFTGVPTAPTPALGTNTTQIATAALVENAVVNLYSQVDSTFAKQSSPAFTGTPTAPTATGGTNNTQIATTAFVANNFLTTTSAAASYATKASPAFTGTPTVPTAAANTNNTQIASTLYVSNAISNINTVPPTGTVGQVLTKTNGTPSGYGWADAPTGGGGGGAVTGFVVPFTGTGAIQNITIPTTSSASDLLVFFGPARQLSNSYTVSGTTVTVTAPNGLGCEIVKLPGFKGDAGATGENGTNGTADAVGEYSNGSNPTSPSTGLRLFARKNAGRNRLAYIGPAGIDVSVQAFLGANKVGYWGAQGNSNTAFNTANPGLMLFNFSHTATGTATTRNVAITNMFTSTRRLGFLSAATVNSSAGTRGSVQFWAGNAAGLGGFEYVTRFGISQVNATTRLYVGMVSTGGVLTATAEPSTQAYLGVGCDSTQSTLRFFSSSSSVDLGANFPSNTQNIDLYEFRLFIPPNGNTTYWSVTRLNTGHYIEGSLATPSKTTLVGPQIWINNAGTASAVAIDVISQYIETDT